MRQDLAWILTTPISLWGMRIVEVTQALSLHIKARLDRDGFVAVPELFEPAEMNELREIIGCSIVPLLNRKQHRSVRLIERIGQDGVPHLDLTEIFYPSVLEPRLLSTRVYQRCAGLARALDQDYARYFDSMITKAPHSQHCVFWHRDASFSPLKRFRAAFLPRVHFWLPVQDVSPANGGLQFIAGSHKEPNVLHLSEARIVANTILAGGVTIHLPETLHYSAPNSSDEKRSAWLMTFGRFGAFKLGLRKFLNKIPASSSLAFKE